MRLFEDDDPGPLASRVYLVTGTAVYKTFADADDVYEQATPGDEYRGLVKTAGGWTLTGLDGAVDSFDDDDRSLGRVDRDGNATTAGYSGGDVGPPAAGRAPAVGLGETLDPQQGAATIAHPRPRHDTSSARATSLIV